MFVLEEDAIAYRLGAMGNAMCERWGGEGVRLVGIMDGAFMFLSDLAKVLGREDVDTVVDFLRVKSYVGDRPGEHVWVQGPGKGDRYRDDGRAVVIVEDIVDTGRTAVRVVEETEVRFGRKPAGFLTLLAKQRPESKDAVQWLTERVPVVDVGFWVPDLFVIGYGLDHDGRYRELPYVRQLL